MKKKTNSSSCLRAFVVAFVLVMCAVAQAALQQIANADNGKRLFMTYYCYSCHGTEGQGGAGPRLVARATPDSLIRYVRKPTGGNMPAYTSKVIADKDLMDIHAYLRSVPPSPPAKTIALLQQ
jgi:ubiquinol-cytochrome c reductase cytochrome c subunit